MNLVKWVLDGIGNILSYGTEGIEDPFEICSRTICNFATAFATLICIGFIIIHVFVTGRMSGILSSVFAGTLFIVLLYLARKGHFRLVRFGIPVAAILGLFVAAYMTGSQSGVAILFLGVFSLIFLVLATEAKWVPPFALSMLIVAYYLIDFNAFGLFSGYQQLPPDLLFKMSIFFKTSAIAFVSVSTYYSVWTVKKSNQQKEAINQQLEEKRLEVNSMLENLEQGIFSVVGGGDIHPTYSKQLEVIFGRTSLAGLKFRKLFEVALDLPPDRIDIMEDIVLTCLGEDPVNFFMNQHILPREMTIEVNGQQKQLELGWNTISFDQSEPVVIDRILISVKDVTEIERMRQETIKNAHDENLLREIISSEISNFDHYIESFQKLFTDAKNAIFSGEGLTPEVVRTVRRNLHTMKGESRFVRWETLASCVHQVEATFDEMGFKATGGKPLDEINITEITGGMLNVANELSEYRFVYKSKLENFALQKQLRQDTDELLTQISDRPISEIHGQSKEIVSALRVFHNYRSLESVIAQSLNRLDELAVSLGKIKPEVTITDDSLLVHQDYETVLRQALAHCFNNSLDHGIELPEERESLGKPSRGHIYVSLRHAGDCSELRFSDDGRGLDIHALYARAREAGHLKGGAEIMDVARSMFKSGVTTRGEISQISGHGVGMEAVYELLHQEGFSVDIALGSEIQKGYYAFELVVLMPHDAAVHRPDLSWLPRVG